MEMLEEKHRNIMINKIVNRYKMEKKKVKIMIKDLKSEGIEISEEDLINKYFDWDKR